MIEVVPPDTVFQVVLDNFNQKDFSDITLIVEGKEIYAHKLIICTRSEVFKKMLSTQMKEGISNVITIEEFGYSTVLKAIQFCYFLPVCFSDFTECLDVLSFSHQFLLTILFDACKDALKLKIEEDNVLEILCASRVFGAKDLEEICWKFVDLSASEILKSDNFLGLEEEIVLEMLDRELNIEEVQVFEASLAWGKYQLQKGNNNISDPCENHKICKILEKIFPLIRYPQMDKTYLITQVKPLSIVPIDLYVEALEFIALDMNENKCLTLNKRFKKRPGTESSQTSTPQTPTNQKRTGIIKRTRRL